MSNNNGLVVPRCARKGCDYEAQWNPVLLIPAPREKVNQARGRIVIHKQDVCQAHKESLRVLDFLGAAGWMQLQFQLNVMGKTPPKEEDLALEWIPVLRGKVS